jgi:flagellar basal-body rod modification protein FlgD
MTDLPLIPISTVTDAANAQPVRTPTNSLDKDAFLRLLVAQLKYQNPMSPSDPNQFMAQTAQFTMVEKLEAMAEDASRQRIVSESMTATAMLGKEITWLDADGKEQSGVVTGSTFGSAGASVVVGETKVPLERVSGVRAPTTTPAPAAPTTPAPPTTTTPTTTDPATNPPATDATDGTDSTTPEPTVPDDPTAQEG